MVLVELAVVLSDVLGGPEVVAVELTEALVLAGLDDVAVSL